MFSRLPGPIIVAVFCFCLPAYAVNIAPDFKPFASLFDDDRAKTWAADWNAGKQYKVLGSATSDLLGKDPHPGAAYVFAVALNGATPDDIPPAATDMVDIYRLYTAKNWQRLAVDFPASRIATMTDPFALQYVAFAYDDADQDDMAHLAAIRLAQTSPGFYGAVWRSDSSDYLQSSRDRIITHASTLKQGAAGQAILASYVHPAMQSADLLAVIKGWLDIAPNDARALRRRGHTLSSLGHLEDALQAYTAADTAWPFYSNAAKRVEMLIRLRRFEMAESLARDLAQRDSGGKNGAEAALLYGNALRLAGEYGKARQHVETAIATFPDHAALQREAVEIEARTGRWQDVATLIAPALAANTGDPRLIQLDIRAQQELGQSAIAYERFMTYRSDGHWLDATSHHYMHKALEELDRHDDAAALVAKMEEQGITDPWIYHNYATTLYAGTDPGAGFDLLARQMRESVPGLWYLNKIKAMATALDRQNDLDLLLADLKASWMHNEHLWRFLADQAPDKTARLAIWEEARILNPQMAFPVTRANQVKRGSKYETIGQSLPWLAQAIADSEHRKVMPDAMVGTLYETLAIDQDEAIRRRRLQDRSLLEKAEQNYHKAYALNRKRKDYVRGLYFIYSRMGKTDKMLPLLRNVMLLEPDSTRWEQFFVNPMAKIAPNTTGLQEVYRWQQRRPKDKKRLKSLIHRHQRWSGSPVVALKLLDDLKRLYPDTDIEKDRKESFSRLGIHKDFYLVRYNQARNLSNSLRYVGWFDRARKDAQQDGNVLKSLDLDQYGVTVTRPDGMALERRYHPVSGRLTYIRLGAASISIAYTDMMDLKSVHAGTRRLVELDYHPTSGPSGKSVISRIALDDGRMVTMKYGDSPRIEIWDIKDVGTLEVDHGDINAEAKTRITHVAAGIEEFQVISAFGSILEDVKKTARLVQQGYDNLAASLPLHDPALDALRADMEKAIDEDNKSWRDKALKTADYLSDRLADHADYGSDALGLVTDIWYDTHDNGPAKQRLEALRLWHKINSQLRPDGLPTALWVEWAQMREWLDRAIHNNLVSARDAQAVEKALRDQPLQLLAGQNWLDRSYASNDGFWQHYPAHALFPRKLGDTVQRRDILARQNGDILVSSNKGLAVFRRGFWTWLAWNGKNGQESEGRFAPSLDYNAADSSVIDAMAEDENGILWVARGGDLLIMGEDYRARPKIWRAKDNTGPADISVTSLAVAGNMVVAGTTTGAWALSADGSAARLAHIPADARITRLRVMDDWRRNEEFYVEDDYHASNSSSVNPRFWHVFAMSENKGAWHQGLADHNAPDNAGPLAHTALHDDALTDLWFDEAENRLFAINGTRLLVSEFTENSKPAWRSLSGQTDILHAGKIFGFTGFIDDEWQEHPAVLTDLGINIYRNWHFEYLQVPNSDRQQPVMAASVNADGNTWLLTGNGVAAIEKGQVDQPLSGRIHDILYDKKGKQTWIANGRALYRMADNDDTGDLDYVDNIHARVLATDDKGRLLANDGTRIVRYFHHEQSPLVLFDSKPSRGNEAWPSAILPASDGSIWVTAGPSVWRYKDGEKQEFNIYDTAGPGAALNSNMLANVIETHDGRIWVVASNEGHLTANGRSMHGGIFEWTGTIFKKPPEFSQKGAGNWFITSYSKTGPSRAIVGTNAGFSLHQGQNITPYSARQDVSYDALADKQPALFQGKRAAQVDTTFSLFATAGGIVGRHQGQWLSLDRLNKMLPAQHLANYGARAVHAVAVDGTGRVLAGTDQGLIIYDPRGAGKTAFMIGEGMAGAVSSSQEQGKMRDVSSRLIMNIDTKSPAGKLTRRIAKLREEIAAAKSLLADPNLVLPERNTGKDTGKKADLPNRKDLQKALRKKEKKQLGLIAKLERSHPAMFQMLQINPLDLRAMGQSLDDDVVLVQYMPTDDQLFVNLVTSNGAELRKVSVKRDDLMHNAALVSRSLAEQVRGLSLRSDGKAQTRSDATGTGLDSDEIDLVFEEMSSEELRAAEASRPSLRHARDVPLLNGPQSQQALSWLYEILLRPIEHELAGKARVYIVPAGSLNYLPFAALISDLSNPDAPRYAVEDFTMAVLPTLYTWDLVQRKDPSTALSSLVYGDSDGTLPAARQEAAEIAEILGEDDVELRLGDDADFDNLETLAADSRYLHLAVHGKLNRSEPENSWLTLAGNKRLGLTDAMLLDLTETELVFLSACETGIGKDGLEFRTLAQAFAHAGAPSVIASLWEVHDEATRHLALSFYESLANEDPIPMALATAQRAMISQGGPLSGPAAWAPFLLFGGK